MEKYNMINIYSNNVFPRDLIITDNLKEAEAQYTNASSNDGTFTHENNALATVYYVNHKNENKGSLLLAIFKPISVKTIAHEALHITRTILEDLPCTLNDDTEEVWCYVIGWVAECIEHFKQAMED